MSALQRSKHDSAIATPVDSSQVSPNHSKEQLDGADRDGWSQLRPSRSAPSTPRSGKKKCHFADTPPEDIDFGSRKTNTAPPNFPDLSLPGTRQQRPPLLDAPAEAEAGGERSRLFRGRGRGRGREVSSAEQQSDHREPQEDDDSSFYSTRADETEGSHRSSSEEELPHVSPDTGTPVGMEIRSDFPFRQEKPRSNTFGSLFPRDLDLPRVGVRSRRSSSLSALYSRPTGASVVKTPAAAATSNIDAHGWNISHDVLEARDSPSASRSNASTDSRDDFLPTTWEEELPAAEDDASSGSTSSKESPGNYTSGSGFPLEKIRTRLSALSRSNGREDTVKKRRSAQESDVTHEELPATPPNTRKPSHSARHGNGRRPRVHPGQPGASSPPLLTPTAESPASSVHGSPPLKPSLKQGGLSRQFGSLNTSDRSAYAHRDSLDLAHHRLANRSSVLDPLLSSARDSVILAKQRFDKYPTSQVIVDEKTGQVKFGGLSPIMDASPPDMRAHFAIRREQQDKEERLAKEQRWKREVGGHPENDDDCPICEVERPRTRRMTLGS